MLNVKNPSLEMFSLMSKDIGFRGIMTLSTVATGIIPQFKLGQQSLFGTWQYIVSNQFVL